ncbi:hypothetical protein N1Z41_00035900 [Pseudomonas aeruginosa]
MKKSSTQVVLDAVRELHSQQQIVTRQTLVELTGLKPGVVDDRLSVLVDDLLVLRVERGVFIPAPQFDHLRADHHHADTRWLGEGRDQR